MENIGLEKLNYKLLIVFAIVIPVVLGASYAYFVPKITDNGGRLVSGTAVEDVHFELITENDGYISATNLVPLTNDQIDTYAAKGMFKIESSDVNTHPLNYTISLTDITITDNLKNADFKWELICTNDNTKNAEGTFENLNSTTLTLKSNLTLAPKATDNYILKLWIQNTDQDQIGILNGKFTGKVSVSAEYVYIAN